MFFMEEKVGERRVLKNKPPLPALPSSRKRWRGVTGND
jgi:hypothetical protein